MQNQDVLESRLDWVLAQPVHLTDAPDERMPFLSTEGHTDRMQVSRRSVARFLAEAVSSPAFVGQAVALSRPSAPGMTDASNAKTNATNALPIDAADAARRLG